MLKLKYFLELGLIPAIFASEIKTNNKNYESTNSKNLTNSLD